MIPVTVHRGGGFDEYGDPIAPTEQFGVELRGVAPRTGEPGTASRDVEQRGREGVIEALTAYAAYEVDIRHDDVIEILDGPYTGTWQVNGTPGSWKNTPFTGWEAGIEFALTRKEG